MKTNTAEAAELATVEDIRVRGSRARTKRIAQDGPPELAENQRINKYRRAAIQYRACVALNYSRDEVLEQTGWSLQWLMTIEEYVEKEDRETFEKRDPRLVFADYRQRQLQCARELEDLTEVYRRSKQFSAMVNAIKARSDILDKILKTGQDLGIIEKKAKKLEVSGGLNVDVSTHTVEELRVHIAAEMREMSDLLGIRQLTEGSAAGAVLARLSGEAPKPKARRVRRIKPPVVIDAEAEPAT